MRAEPTFVDLFSGCGGLTLGLQQAGWRCLLGVDHWRDAVDTYNHNFDGHHRAEKVEVDELSERKLSQLLDERPAWVVGGPPCQGFSTVGKRKREDPRNALVRHFRDVVQRLDPDGFLIENVVGLKVMDFEKPVRELFADLPYAVTAIELRAADYGVPQLRRRILFIGHKGLGEFAGPAKTAGEAFTTVWDAIGDLPEVGPGETRRDYDREPFTGYQRRLREGSEWLQGHTVSKHPPGLVKAISFIPDGGNRRSIPNRYQPRSGYHNSYSRLSSKAPAVAVTSNMGKPSGTRCIHPFQHRGLTAREGARLQGFPDTFHFLGGVVSQRLQIANAVPVMLAEAIGLALVDESRWERTAKPALAAVA